MAVVGRQAINCPSLQPRKQVGKTCSVGYFLTYDAKPHRRDEVRDNFHKRENSVLLKATLSYLKATLGVYSDLNAQRVGEKNSSSTANTET